jgi:hypothetical protein
VGGSAVTIVDSTIGLVFDPDAHKYYLNGEELPSVSKIKEPVSPDFSMVRADVMQRACDFGHALHTMVELYFKGELDLGSLDDALFGPLEALEKWLVEIKPFEHPGVVIDIKSRKYDRDSDPLQLAAYHQLWLEDGSREPIIERPMASIKYRFAGTPDIIIPPVEGEVITDWRILYLGLDGKYAYTRVYDRNAWPMFGRLLGDYYRAQETENLINSWRNR